LYFPWFACFWRDSLQWARAFSFTRFPDHTQRSLQSVHSSGRVISFSKGPVPDNTTTYRHQCPRWDSNPQSQQASGHRPTPYELYTLSVTLSDFSVWRDTWRENLVNCAVLTGNSPGLKTVLSTRLSHRELRSSLCETHSFLSLPADTTMASSQVTQQNWPKNWHTWWKTSAVPENIQFSFSCSFFLHTARFNLSVWGPLDRAATETGIFHGSYI
jgi:hypothetical protein